MDIRGLCRLETAARKIVAPQNGTGIRTDQTAGSDRLTEPLGALVAVVTKLVLLLLIDILATSLR